MTSFHCNADREAIDEVATMTLWLLLAQAVALRNRYDRRQHRCHQLGFSLAVRVGIGGANRQRAAGSFHLRLCDDLPPFGRREQIDLKFNRQNRHIRGHQAESGVATRTIQNRCDNAGVEKTVLLRQIRAKRQHDFHRARLNRRQRRANRSHHFLTGEAGANARFKFGILWREAGHLFL